MKILLVEDDAGIARFIQRGLLGEGYRVDWQRDGRQVHATLATDDYAAAVLDLGLPDGDGVELCRTLRSDGVRTPIIMLTARTALQDRLDGFDAGTDDYLAKPFAFDELVARLAALVRRDSGRRDQLRCGALRLEITAREAFVGTTALSLSRREFDVLAVLARARGEVVTRAELLAQAWGEGQDVGDNSVDVYIGYVRRALLGATDAPHIQTLRGRGFRLIPKDNLQ